MFICVYLYYKCAKLFNLRKFFKLNDCLFTTENTEGTEKSVFICVYLCESVSHVNLCVLCALCGYLNLGCGQRPRGGYHGSFHIWLY